MASGAITSSRNTTPRSRDTTGIRYVMKLARVEPTLPTRFPIRMKARPVPRNPTAIVAASESQAKSDRVSPKRPKGVTISAAVHSTRAITGTDPYFCWSGTTMLVARP